METTPLLPESARRVCEVVLGADTALVHREWRDAFPWLVQGTTTRGAAQRPFDLGLFSSGSARDQVLRNWEAVREAAGAHHVVHARQVHGDQVHLHTRDSVVAMGRVETTMLSLAPDADGHMTRMPGLLLGVTTADCVPVFVVDPVRVAVAVLHAGWRGVAAGVLERGLARMQRDFGSLRRDLRVHLGPAICGRCYEVGPEVFAALGEAAPPAPSLIDVRAVLARRALSDGIAPEYLTVSTHCTRCTGSSLFSHRGGDRQRQVGYLGIRGLAEAS
jgi:YfiH family protein